jgi:hypothetical protein
MTSTTTPTNDTPTPAGPDRVVVEFTRGTARFIRLFGVLALIAGIGMVLAGGVVWGMVSSELAAEKIVVAEDSTLLPGVPVTGPLSAYAEAEIISHHALEASGGQTYAELDRDDPVRATMMNASFLRASLFTSVVSFGVAAFAMGMGLFVAATGWVLTRIAPKQATR